MKAMLNMVFALMLAGCGLVGCTSKPPPLEPKLVEFVQAKQAQTKALVRAQNLTMPSEGWQLFDAILANDWHTATNCFAELSQMRFGTAPSTSPVRKAFDWVRALLQNAGVFRAKTLALQSVAWQPLSEAHWAYVQTRTWHKPHLEWVVRNIRTAVATNAIYFGGTDSGRYALTAAMDSHLEGRPFFVLTQNALADGTYLDYLRSMFSNHLYVPTPTDSQQAFQTYLTDAQRRLEAGQLKSGENVTVANNRVSVSGHLAVMEINALLVKVIFDQNPGREVFIEQSWPLDWTYPHLIPCGPIFKINREPLARLPDSVLQADRAFWSDGCERLIGDWITTETSVGEVCDFAERVYVRQDLAGFKGNPQYLQDKAAQEGVSKLRYAIADVYLWRCSEATDTAEKERMLTEGMLAFQQAFALGPGNYEVVNNFSGMLAQMARFDDAKRIVQVSSMLSPTNATLLQRLEKAKADSIGAKSH